MTEPDEPRTAPARMLLIKEGAVYSEDQLATILHTTIDTVRGLRQTGQIRYLPVGRKAVYPAEYIREYIAKRGVLDTDPVADRLRAVARR